MDERESVLMAEVALLGYFLRTPKDNVRQTSLPLGPLSGYTRGQTTQETDKPSPGTPLRVHQGTNYTGNTGNRQAFPWDHSKGTPGDKLHRKQTSLPLGPLSGCTRGKTTEETDKPTPGTPLRVYQGTCRLHRKQMRLPLGPLSGYTRGQTTQRTDISDLITERR